MTHTRTHIHTHTLLEASCQLSPTEEIVCDWQASAVAMETKGVENWTSNRNGRHERVLAVVRSATVYTVRDSVFSEPGVPDVSSCVCVYVCVCVRACRGEVFICDAPRLFL